jgi:hypothetical protein
MAGAPIEKDPALEFGEAVDRAHHDSQAFTLDDCVGRIRGPSDACIRFPIAIDVFVVLRSPATVLSADVPGNCEKPGLRVPGLSPPAANLPGSQNRLLDCILNAVGVLHPARDGAPNQLPVPQ